jgi:hypothetical protein
MTKKVRYTIYLVALSVILALRARDLSAQAQVISLAAVKPGNLAVTILSGAAQTIAGLTDNAVNNFPSPVVIQTDWNVKNQTNSVELMAYFSVPAQAMTRGAIQIPSSRIRGRMLSGLPTTFTAMAQNGVGGVGTAGGSLHLFSDDITKKTKKDSRTDNLELQLDLVGFPTLPAGAYTGTLNIRAVTQ